MVVCFTNFYSEKDCDFLYCAKIREDLKDLRKEMWLSLNLIFIFLCFLLLLISFLKIYLSFSFLDFSWVFFFLLSFLESTRLS